MVEGGERRLWRRGRRGRRKQRRIGHPQRRRRVPRPFLRHRHRFLRGGPRVPLELPEDRRGREGEFLARLWSPPRSLYHRVVVFQITPWEAIKEELKFVVRCGNDSKPVRKKAAEDTDGSFMRMPIDYNYDK